MEINWKEKYEAALERARGLYDFYKGNPAHAQPFVDIFPELAESEDERIRKALIEGVRQIRCKNGITQEQMIAYLEKQKESSQDDIAAAYQLGRADERKAKEQKPVAHENDFVSKEWSEEDEKMLEAFLHKVEVCDLLTNKENVWIVKKLKSLRPQPKQEWSDEDEIYLQDALWCVKQASTIARGENDMGACWSAERWLNSLKARCIYKPHWKPSEEQMRALRLATNNLWVQEHLQAHILISLYNDLEKL